MSTRYSLRCGRCGALFYSSYESPDRIKYFGKTIQNCPKCGNLVFISFAYEWENLTLDEKKKVICFGGQFDLNINPDRFLSPYKRDKAGMEKWCNFSFDGDMLEIPYIKESIVRTQDIEYRKKLLLQGRKFYGSEFK